MYEIILKTWYQETPDQRDDEVYDQAFKSIPEAVNHLNDNIEKILDEFPVDGEVTIKFNKDRK